MASSIIAPMLQLPVGKLLNSDRSIAEKTMSVRRRTGFGFHDADHTHSCVSSAPEMLPHVKGLARPVRFPCSPPTSSRWPPPTPAVLFCSRFYLGGPTSVRGFSMHSVGPQSEGLSSPAALPRRSQGRVEVRAASRFSKACV